MRKRYLYILIIFILTSNLFSAVIISRHELGIVTKELYHQNRFAEIHDDRIVSIWDFNQNELTLINHYLRVYATINFDDFKIQLQMQNRAHIQSQINELGTERIQMMSGATLGLFNQIRAGFILVDTLDVSGFKAFEFHVYNTNILAQKLWISPDLQKRIDREVQPEKIKAVEAIFKSNRDEYLRAMMIRLDPISSVVEDIEEVGYVVRRVDYGLRSAPNPEFEAEADKLAGFVNDVVVMAIDSEIFNFHKIYKQVSFLEYQVLTTGD